MLVDPWSGNYFDLAAAKFMAPIGLEHFFDAFALNQKRLLKVDAAAALHLPLDDVSDSLVVKQARANMFDLTPVWAPAEPPAKRAKTAEVRLSSTGDVPMTPRNEDNARNRCVVVKEHLPASLRACSGVKDCVCKCFCNCCVMLLTLSWQGATVMWLWSQLMMTP